MSRDKNSLTSPQGSASCCVHALSRFLGGPSGLAHPLTPAQHDSQRIRVCDRVFYSQEGAHVIVFLQPGASKENGVKEVRAASTLIELEPDDWSASAFI